MKKIWYDIVIVGYIGGLGSAKIAKQYREETMAAYQEISSLILKYESGKGHILWKSPYNTGWYDECTMSVEEIFYTYGVKKEEIYACGKGGILSALYDMALERRAGFSVRIKDMPILQLTVEVCEYFHLNPYRIESDAYILLCERGVRLVNELKKQGFVAEHVGYLTDGLDKVIVDKEHIEYVNKEGKSELDKLLENIAIYEE